MRLCQMSKAGFYVGFPFARIGIIFLFSSLECGPAGDPVVCIDRMNMYLAPTWAVQQYQRSVTFRGILV